MEGGEKELMKMTHMYCSNSKNVADICYAGRRGSGLEDINSLSDFRGERNVILWLRSSEKVPHVSGAALMLPVSSQGISKN